MSQKPKVNTDVRGGKKKECQIFQQGPVKGERTMPLNLAISNSFQISLSEESVGKASQWEENREIGTKTG